MRVFARAVQSAIKRALDILVALGVLVVASPVIAALALLIRVKIGSPVFFRQRRLGRNGRPFTLVKLRTMTDARDDNGNLLPDDLRLLPLGRRLRSTTLDELPELLNVLVGDMSVVGPRPLPVEYWDRYSAHQRRRHEMRPGMAGPVVAARRNAMTWDEKFAADVKYVEDWSLWLDAKVLTKSFRTVLSGRGISAEGHATMPEFEGSGRDDETKESGAGS